MKKVFLDLNYYSEKTKSPNLILSKYSYNFNFLKYLTEFVVVISLSRIKVNASYRKDDVHYKFYKGSTLRKWQIPFKFHFFIKKLNPDYILIHGMGYVFLAACLDMLLSSRTIILLQSNGYSIPPKGIKKIIFKWAAKRIDGFLFTGKKNANLWVENTIFSSSKVFEVMEGATDFKFDTSIKKKEQSFLWVGRLDNNKDPITILKAFEQYLYDEPKAKLTMVYSDFQLLDEVSTVIDSSEYLRKAITKRGKLEREEIEVLYQNHQYFVLGSHYEGSGYALMEAMACGCVPIVTRIPSFNYMTNQGSCALQFRPGNRQELFQTFRKTKTINYEDLQSKVLKQVDEKLSHKAIAKDIYNVFTHLESKKQE